MQHVVAIFDRGAMKLYINAVLVAQAATTLRPVDVLQADDNPAIGIGNAGGKRYNLPFDGLIDEVRIYNRACPTAKLPRAWPDSRKFPTELPKAARYGEARAPQRFRASHASCTALERVMHFFSGNSAGAWNANGVQSVSPARRWREKGGRRMGEPLPAAGCPGSSSTRAPNPHREVVTNFPSEPHGLAVDFAERVASKVRDTL